MKRKHVKRFTDRGEVHFETPCVNFIFPHNSALPFLRRMAVQSSFPINERIISVLLNFHSR